MLFSTPQPSLAQDTLLDVLRLIRTPSIGPVTFFALLRRFGNCKTALDALPELAARGGRKQALIAATTTQAQAEIEACDKLGARLIIYGQPNYPAHLLNIPDAPPIIAVLGNPKLWQGRDNIAMVGARNASAHGCQFASQLAHKLGTHSVTIVSGLARGIDTHAHKGSLSSGTVGVIAGGIDTIYPPENEKLYELMREQGAIISEQPFGQLPFAGSFPGRNRIIAGMTLGTVVVEASPRSGSLITARFASDYGREVFAVPGSPLDPRSKGCNQLLREGATMVESADDILNALSPYRHNSAQETQTTYTPPQPSLPSDDASLQKLRTTLTEKLSSNAVSVDELVEQCECNAQEVMTILLELELAGKLKRSAGNKVSITPEMEPAT